jgi:amino acid adenylation domain-containing protein
MNPQCPSFAHLLWERAQQDPDKNAFSYLSEPRGILTYGSLHLRAAALAARLRAIAAPAERAVLLVPPGLDYIVAFFGCMYAGLIAVPAYPPLDDRQMPRLVSLIRNSRPRVVLTLAALAGPTRESLRRHGASAAIDVVACDGAEDLEPLGSPPDIGRGDVAFLQYTSGSASDPKGVIVTHDSLFDNSAAIKTLFGHDTASSGVAWLPPYHDMGLIGCILQPLYAGFPVALMSPLHFLAQPAAWLEAVSEHRATTSGGPNFAFDLCVRKVTEEQRAGLDLSSWSLAFCGAEPVRPQTLERFAEAFAPCGFRREALYPCYGLAESTLIAAGGRKGAGPAIRGGVVSCGEAIPGHRLSVRGPGGTQDAADGEIGEVCLSGPSVSPGYWDSPEASAEAFATDPADGHTLRTGDLGFLHDGALFVTGRRKDLIIVRGRNLAAEDAEYAVAGCHPMVRPGCVAAFGLTEDDGEALVVLAELRRDDADGPVLRDVSDSVQAALAAQFGVSAGRVLLGRRGSVRKTPSGKIRRAECRRRYLAGELTLFADQRPAARAAGAGALAEGIAASLAGLAASVLGLPEGSVPAGAALTTLGMDSLRAVELRHIAQGRLALNIPLQALLGGASPAELARAASPVGADMAAPAAGTADVVTDGERALWLTSRLSGDPANYVLTIALNLRGHIDPDAFERALRLLAERHPAMRTYFPDVSGQPRRRAAGGALSLEVVRLGSGAAVDRWISDFAAQGVDPSKGSPWKVALLRADGGPEVLVLCAHHMACDLWSLDILAHEFVHAYDLLRRGQRPDWAPAGDPARIAARLEGALSGEHGQLLEAFWRAELADAPPSGGLPQARQKARGSAPAGRHQMLLPASLVRRVRDLARSTGVTPYTVAFTGFAWLLHSYTGERRFVLGVPAPGRLDPESASAVGYFVNPLPLVCEIDPAEGFSTHLHRFRDRIAAALGHQEYPYQRILDHCGPRRGEPAIRVLVLQQQAPTGDALSLLSAGSPGADSPGAKAGSFFTPRLVEQRNAPFELTIEIADAGDGFACSFTYDAEVLTGPDVAAAAGHWMRLLEQVTAESAMLPQDVAILGDAERRLLLRDWNAPIVAVDGPATLHEAILGVAARHPAAVAAYDSDGELTYAELDRRSARLAAALVARGAGPGRPAGLMLPRSTGLIVAMLAALRAGAPYVPLDPDHPDARLAMIAQDARPAVIVTGPGTAATRQVLHGATVLAEEEVADAGPPPLAPGHPDWPAYVMYTSGSTGTPKGVVCGHRGVLNLLADARLADAARLGDRCGWWTSPGFDVSVYEVFCALTAGAAVEVCPPAARHEAAAFMEWAAARGVTSAYIPPHLLPGLPAWLNRNPGRSRLRHAMVSVEPIPEPLLRTVMRLAPGLAVTNGYGPTEATIFSTLHTVDPGGTQDGITPMGRAVANCPHYLLDSYLRLVPPGAVGEVCIGGSGLAHGYHGRGAATAQQFTPSPFLAGERLYRTGDLARYLPGGQLVFLGRRDDQVKVRGMRIEPREVEAVLAGHPEVSAAVVLAGGTADGPGLIGYARVSGDRAGDRDLAADISRHVRERLPSPMVPRHVVLLGDWPMTINGKIDRARLPRPDTSLRDYAPPDGEVEAAVAGVWAELLSEARVGRTDDFFDLGGDSLLAARSATRLAEQLGVPVDAVDIMDYPVVAVLAAEIAGRAPQSPSADGDALRALADHVAGLPADVMQQIISQTGGRVS